MPGTPSVTAAMPTPSRHQPAETRAIQAWMEHKNIQHAVRYTEVAPDRLKDFWRD